jgi:phosphatidylglycerol:prolipoprotein diacylglycerol transferase
MNEFWNFWQHLPANIDPVIFQIGSFRLQYYGLMYIVAFGCTYALARYRLKTEPRWDLSVEHLQGVMTAIIIGLVLGARLGYVLFYNLGYYLQHPLEVFLPFEFQNGVRFTGISGMSYHGGLIGCIIGALWYIRKYRLSFTKVSDLLVPCIPAGYTFGRLGNFINGELWGRVTTAPIGMYFPDAPGDSLRHPSQLYEAFGEGILLFVVLWSLRNRIRTPGVMLALYLIGYGIVRFIIEFFREPDAHLGFIFFSLSMGQLLCLVMICAGAVLLGFHSRERA